MVGGRRTAGGSFPAMRWMVAPDADPVYDSSWTASKAETGSTVGGGGPSDNPAGAAV